MTSTLRGGGGLTKCRRSKGGCVDLVLWILPKCRQGGGGGPKSRKLCRRHLSMAPNGAPKPLCMINGAGNLAFFFPLFFPHSPFVAVLYFLFVKVQLGGSGLLSGKRVRRVGEREVQRLILRVGSLSPWKVPFCKVW